MKKTDVNIPLIIKSDPENKMFAAGISLVIISCFSLS
jgi:hypothetical protein